MKIVKTTWRHPSYWQRWMAAGPATASASYDELCNHVFADMMGTCDAWGHALREIGHDAVDIPLGIRPLEEAWWREFGGSGAAPHSKIITQKVLQKADPEILIVEGLEAYSAADIRQFREWLPKLKMFIGITGNEIHDDDIFRPLDLLLSIGPAYVEKVRAKGLRAERLLHSFDKRILPKIDDVERTTDVVFAGLIQPGKGYHEDRRHVLEQVADISDLKIYTDSRLDLAGSLREYITKTTAFCVAHGANLFGIAPQKLPAPKQMEKALSWKRPPAINWSPKLSGRIEPGVYGLDFYRAIAGARATLNVQPGLAGKYATNMRLYEATGVGTCLITNHNDDLENFFSPDEVVSFKTPDEAISKTRELLQYPDQLATIAKLGQKRTLSSHTYEHRMNDFLGWIKLYL